MKTQLYSKKVITRDQRILIDTQIGRDKMDYLIVDIIIPSLEVQFSKKYKSLLQVMEDNDDIDLKNAAKMLGRLIMCITINVTGPARTEIISARKICNF